MATRNKGNGAAAPAAPRFAALERVSTRRQAERGETLRLHYKRNEDDIKAVGGMLARHYNAGKGESATPGNEHVVVESMIQDAQKGDFNAIIVQELDRWSRDPEVAARWLGTLERASVNIWEGRREYKLDDDRDRLIIDVRLGIARFESSRRLRASFDSKLARAKRGWPTFGRMYFGYFNTETDTSKKAHSVPIPECRDYLLTIRSWYIDEEISWLNITRRLKKGRTKWDALEQRLRSKYPGFLRLPRNTERLRRILTDVAGRREWVQTIHKKGYEETIRFPIAQPLLTQDEIKAVRDKGSLRRDKPIGTPYPLSRFLFCASCKRSMNVGDRRHYRHKCSDGHWKYFSIERLEDAVFREIGMFLKSKKGELRERIADAVTDRARDIKGTENRVKELAGLIDRLAKREDALDEAIADERDRSRRRKLQQKARAISHELEESKAEHRRLKARLDALREPIDDRLAEQVTKLLSEVSNRVYVKLERGGRKDWRQRPSILNLSPERKRELLKWLMGGQIPPRKDPQLGIFVSQDMVRLQGVLGIVERPLASRKAGRKLIHAVDLDGLARLISAWEDSAPKRSVKQHSRVAAPVCARRRCRWLPAAAR